MFPFFGGLLEPEIGEAFPKLIVAASIARRLIDTGKSTGLRAIYCTDLKVMSFGINLTAKTKKFQSNGCIYGRTASMTIGLGKRKNVLLRT